MSGNHSRTKGRRFEQELVNLFKSHNISAKRISMMETGREDKGDLQAADLKVEVKGGDQVPLFLYKARKTDEELLCMRRDRSKWLVCMDLEWFIDKYLCKDDKQDN
ncbi:MAG: hypothetical protein WC243_03030 [Patescibacteria group bacterium]|jgi:hypothetical protein